MASHDITFRVLGSLDPSLLAALQQAHKGIAGLSNAQKSFNAKALAQAQKLAAAQSVMKNVAAYKALQNAIRMNRANLAGERLQLQTLQSARESEVNKLGEMRQAYQRLQTVYRENRRSMGADAAQVMKSQMQAARLEIKAQADNVKSIDKEMAAAAKSVANLNRQLSDQQAKLAQLSAKVNVGNLAAQEAALRAQIQSTTQALNAEIEALNRRNQIHSNFANAQQNLANAYSNFQNATQTAQSIMNPFVSATKTAMDFEYQMKRVQAVTEMKNIRAGNLRQVTADMAAFEAQAKALGASTEYTATEIAQAQYFFGMSGWKPEQIMAAVPSMVDLATVSGTDLGRMADLISDTATAMGVKAGDTITLGNGKVVDAMQHYTDSWAYAITNANLDTETLGLSLKYNGAAMHQAGLSQGDIFAANMVAANFGSKGSMAGTAFRSGMIRLQAPAKKGAQALEEMGLNASEAQKEMAAAGAAMAKLDVQGTSVMDKIVAIKKRFDENLAAGNSDANAAMINDIFGKNAFQTWAGIMQNANLEQLQKFAAEMNSGEIEGWTAETAGVMRDSANVQFELLKSAIDACAESLGHIFLPAAVTTFQTLASGASSLNEWIKHNQTAAQWLGVLAAGLSGAIVLFAGLGVASAAFSVISTGAAVAGGAITGFVSLLGAARTAIMSFGAVSAIAGAIATAPIWAIAAAVIGVIGVIGYATGAFDGLGTAIANAWNHPQGAITGFCELAKSAVDNAVNYVVNRWNTLRSALAHPIDAMINFLDHGDVIGGSVVSGEQQAAERASAQAHSIASNGQFGGGGASFGGSVDTSALQSAVNETANVFNQIPPPAYALSNSMLMATPATQNFISAAQNAQFGIDSFNASTTNAQFGVDSFNASTTNAQFGVDSFNASTTNAAFGVDSMGNCAANSTFGIDSMTAAAANSGASVDSMAGSAANASGALGGLGAAVSSAIGALMSAGASAASYVSSAASSAVNFIASIGAPAHNARGGIYPKGQFLTTFAESSPEAAIPIDSSARAKNLWLETGHLLGFSNILPTNQRRSPIDFPVMTPPTFPTSKRRSPIDFPVMTPPTFPTNQRRKPINFPVMTPPTFPTNQRRSPIDFPVMTPPTFPDNDLRLDEMPTQGAANISIVINVNISGNADEGTVQRGIEDALPRVESFAEQLAAYRHERARKSYA